jgi:Fe-S cluster assembly protein SufD
MTLTATKTKAEQALSRNFEAVVGRLPGGAEVGEARKAAIGAFATLGLPHRRIEAWKYTDLRSLFRDALPPAVGTDAAGGEVTVAAIERALEGLAALKAHRLVFADGAHRGDLSGPLPEGVTFTALAAALAGAGSSAASLLTAGRAAEHEAIVALNTAFMSDGAVLHVGERLAAPLLIVFVHAGRQGQLVTTRNRITIGAGARATIIEAHIAVPEAAPGQSNTLSEVCLAEGARLDHVTLTLAGEAASHLATWIVALGARSHYRAFQLTAATALARNSLFATFAGEAAKLDVSSCFLGRGSQHSDTTLVVDHAAPAGESRELFKGVLTDRSHSVFQGKVIVRQDAQKTDGKQMAQALMLSDAAEFDCKPELEIHADDVACGHGATSAEIDPDMLFYLLARGIPPPEARALLIESFIGEAIDRLESEPIRSAMWQSAKARLLSLAHSQNAEDRR